MFQPSRSLQINLPYSFTRWRCGHCCCEENMRPAVEVRYILQENIRTHTLVSHVFQLAFHFVYCPEFLNVHKQTLFYSHLKVTCHVGISIVPYVKRLLSNVNTLCQGKQNITKQISHHYQTSCETPVTLTVRINKEFNL